MVLLSDGTGWIVLQRIGRQPPALSSGVLNLPSITGLTGGGTNLDGLVTADGRYPAGTIVLLTYNDDIPEMWKRISGTNTEDAPAGRVLPDDYNGVSNAFWWKRIS